MALRGKKRKIQRCLTIHPGKLVSVLGGSAKAPDRHWTELVRCPPQLGVRLGVDLAMRPEIPVQLGGTGLVRYRTRTRQTAEKALYSIMSRPTPISETVYHNYGIVGEKKKEVKIVPGYIKVDKGLWKEHVADRYSNKKSIYWTQTAAENSLSDSDLENISLLCENDDVVNSVHDLIDIYHNAAEEGKIILEDVSVPIMMPYERITIPMLPKGIKKKIYVKGDEERVQALLQELDRPKQEKAISEEEWSQIWIQDRAAEEAEALIRPTLVPKINHDLNMVGRERPLVLPAHLYE